MSAVSLTKTINLTCGNRVDILIAIDQSASVAGLIRIDVQMHSRHPPAAAPVFSIGFGNGIG